MARKHNEPPEPPSHEQELMEQTDAVGVVEEPRFPRHDEPPPLKDGEQVAVSLRGDPSTMTPKERFELVKQMMKKGPVVGVKHDEPPSHGYVRYISDTPSIKFVLETTQVEDRLGQDRKILRAITAQEVGMQFKNHICDVSEDISWKLKTKEMEGHFSFGSPVISAELLAALLEDEDGAILDTRGQSMGGRATALDFIGRMAKNSIYCNLHDGKKDVEKFKIDFVSEWQRKLSKWGYTRTGQFINSDAKMEALAAKYGVNAEVAREMLRDATAQA